MACTWCRRPVHLLLLALLLTAGRTPLWAEEARGAYRILVEPNVQVSKDLPTPHVEPTAATSPVDPELLLAAAMVFRTPGRSQEVRLYTSSDGGYTWTNLLLPERTDSWSADPQLGFGPRGTAYALMLASSGTLFYRSVDPIRTWERIRAVPRLGDYPQMAVDRTTSPFRGRVYVVSTEVDAHGYWVGLTSSADEGQTFAALTRLPAPPGKGTVKPLRPVVQGDGTLLVFCLAWDVSASAENPARTVYTVTSRDGGKTFSQPVAVLDFPWRDSGKDGARNDRVGQGTVGADVAITQGPGTDRGERLCMAWVKRGPNDQRVTARCSDDGGKTWSPPVVVGPAPAGWQHQVMAAINPRGVIGVAWLDTRADPQGGRYDLYFAASSDGGKTFVPARRVTTVSSDANGAGNRALWPSFARPTERGTELHLTSALRRWPTGGDYAAMLVDANGAFRPFWPDARSGAFQVYTARVWVLPPTEAARLVREPAGLTPRQVDGVVSVECESSETPRPEGEVRLRVRNISSDRLYGPLRVSVSAAGGWEVVEGAELMPSMADLPFLPPKGVTEPVRVRLRAGAGATHLPVLTLTVTARTTPAPGKDQR